jgi:hypothetical protein
MKKHGDMRAGNGTRALTVKNTSRTTRGAAAKRIEKGWAQIKIIPAEQVGMQRDYLVAALFGDA